VTSAVYCTEVGQALGFRRRDGEVASFLPQMNKRCIVQVLGLRKPGLCRAWFMASAEQELLLVRLLSLEEQTVQWPGSVPQHGICLLGFRKTGVAVASFLV
jgi:hypothetical protein